MRLIDADAFRDRCLTWLHVDSQQADEQDDMAACMVMEIDAAPTVEAEVVRHGRWIAGSTDYPEPDFDFCSECGFEISRGYGYDPPEWKRCPNCAAKMKEEPGNG